MSDKNQKSIAKKYQVFVSSTFEDLKKERKKAVEVVVAEGHIPVDLSLFAAKSKKDLDVITQSIKDCQIYIVILGHCYGSLITDRRLYDLLDDTELNKSKKMSYTEFEYRLAEKEGLIILPFILEDEIIEQNRKALNPKNSREDQELKNYELLKNFHDYVKNSKFYKPFGAEEDFKFLLLQSLKDAISETDRTGWIREPENPKQQELIESVSKNPFILDIVEHLSSFEALSGRFNRHKEKKIAAANFFTKIYHNAIFDHESNLFLESGSSVAYVANALAERLVQHIKIDDSGNASINISTNNVVAYQLLWLCHKIPITLFPWGGPEFAYGATYGCLDELEDMDPNYGRPPLNKHELNEIKKLKKMRFSFSDWDSPGLLLGATSGLQVSEEHKIVKVEKKDGKVTIVNEPVSEKVRELIGHCYGPHVGSYKNKIFKRFMYDVGHPVMIFLESDKIDCQIKAEVCHFMLDRNLTWHKFHINHPLAFCIGCSQTGKDNLVHKFRDMKLDVIPGNDVDEFTAIIARNSVFIEKFEKLVEFVVPSQ